MTIAELQQIIKKACIEFSKDNKLGVSGINIDTTFEYGSTVPISYEIEITVK